MSAIIFIGSYFCIEYNLSFSSGYNSVSILKFTFSQDNWQVKTSNLNYDQTTIDQDQEQNSQVTDRRV